jgi:hypothetical protein
LAPGLRPTGVSSDPVAASTSVTTPACRAIPGPAVLSRFLPLRWAWRTASRSHVKLDRTVGGHRGVRPPVRRLRRRARSCPPPGRPARRWNRCFAPGVQVTRHPPRGSARKPEGAIRQRSTHQSLGRWNARRGCHGQPEGFRIEAVARPGLTATPKSASHNAGRLRRWQQSDRGASARR